MVLVKLLPHSPPPHAPDALTLGRTNLTVLDNVGASHGVAHVGAGVVVRVPLAAPCTGHA